MDNLTAYKHGSVEFWRSTSICMSRAMVAGLGLVLSEQSTANLDLSQPFITVIPDDKIDDFEYLDEKIQENREISLGMRKEIREYCYNNFDWVNVIKKYKSIIESI